MLDNVRHTLMCSAAKEAGTTTKQDLRENEHDANTPMHYPIGVMTRRLAADSRQRSGFVVRSSREGL